jgi:hypothetical protein
MKDEVYIGGRARLPLLHCPACSQLVDAARSVSLDDKPTRPRSGAFTVCLYCATLLMFEESSTSTCGLGLRRVSASEVEDLKRRDPKFAAMLAKLLEAARELASSQKRKGQG